MNFCNGFYFFSNACLRSIPAMMLSACLVGCGQPQYPERPKNLVHVTKGAFGGELTIENGADTVASIRGLKFNKASGEVELDEATFDSKQSKNEEILIQWMAQYIGQQAGYRAIRETEWAGLNSNPIVQGIGAAIPMLPGVLGQYVQGRTMVGVAKQQTRQVVAQAAATLLAGKSGLSPVNPLSLWRSLGPEIQDGVAAEYPDAVPSGAAVSSQPARVAE